MVSQNGGLKLFRLFGIDVYLHWTWAIAAYYLIQTRVTSTYTAPWATAEVLTLFGIVLMHEFGHALACKSVGGQANLIVLWPLGGVAFVSPPHRPGAVLWSIFAGPMVNMLLLPVTLLAVHFGPAQGNLAYLLYHVAEINTVLLIFNLLPIFPLDGGQILQSLLWFFMRYERSLLIVSVIGLIAGAALAGLALAQRATWTVIMAGFIILQAWRGFTVSRQILAETRARRSTPPPLPTGTVDAAKLSSFDPQTHRIVSESYEDAVRRERFAASGTPRHNPTPPPLPDDAR